jgi:hypothetical protein
MLLGALLDAGADLAAVRAAVTSLGVPELDITVSPTRRCGLRCARTVVVTPATDQPTRGLAEVLAAIEQAPLGAAAARAAADTFRLLADAEAAVHGIPAELVHFHEVGAADALADVVGTAVAAEQLGLLADGALVTCSALAAGSGTARSAHGTIPVPAPAVLQIAADRGLSLTGGDLAGERSTPTGAALVAVLAAPGPLPPMTVDAVGNGAGRLDTPERPNITRLVIGRRTGPGSAPGPAEPVTVVETTVDDLDPELWPGVLLAVRAAGPPPPSVDTADLGRCSPRCAPSRSARLWWMRCSGTAPRWAYGGLAGNAPRCRASPSRSRWARLGPSKRSTSRLPPDREGSRLSSQNSPTPNASPSYSVGRCAGCVRPPCRLTITTIRPAW